MEMIRANRPTGSNARSARLDTNTNANANAKAKRQSLLHALETRARLCMIYDGEQVHLSAEFEFEFKF